jgi:hypothetical protein
LSPDNTALVDDYLLALWNLKRTRVREHGMASLIDQLTFIVQLEISRPLKGLALGCLNQKESTSTDCQM